MIINWPEAVKFLESLPSSRPRDQLLGLASGKCLLKKSRPVRALARKEKQDTPKALKKELDRVFSIFIRRRDSQGKDWGRCVTCGYAAPWKSMDCGHYQLRQYLNTRWDERNCHLQCKGCNGPRKGEMEKMANYIDTKYGAGTSDTLRIKAKMPCRLHRDILKLRIAEYKRKIGE